MVRDRYTVVEKVYHQQEGKSPTGFVSTFSRPIQRSEQAYLRQLVADESWKKLDLGWVSNPGLICISNLEGRYLKVNLSEEEKADLERHILEVSYSEEGPGWLIHPRATFRGCPTCPGELMIRSHCGLISYQVFILPL